MEINVFLYSKQVQGMSTYTEWGVHANAVQWCQKACPSVSITSHPQAHLFYHLSLSVSSFSSVVTMPWILFDPSSLLCLDYALDIFQLTQAPLVNDTTTHNQATALLTNLWTTSNAAEKLLWQAQLNTDKLEVYVTQWEHTRTEQTRNKVNKVVVWLLVNVHGNPNLNLVTSTPSKWCMSTSIKSGVYTLSVQWN